jgi:hypothetical protein
MLHGDRELPHCQGMMTFTDLASVPSHPLAPFTDRLRLAVAAYLARFKGSSRQHTGSDLRCYLAWWDCNLNGVTSGTEETPDDQCDDWPGPGRSGAVRGR